MVWRARPWLRWFGLAMTSPSLAWRRRVAPIRAAADRGVRPPGCSLAGGARGALRSCLARRRPPDLARVVADGPVGREPAHLGGVDDRARPPGLRIPERVLDR